MLRAVRFVDSIQWCNSWCVLNRGKLLNEPLADSKNAFILYCCSPLELAGWLAGVVVVVVVVRHRHHQQFHNIHVRVCTRWWWVFFFHVHSLCVLCARTFHAKAHSYPGWKRNSCAHLLSMSVYTRFTSHSIHVAHIPSTSLYRLQTVVSVRLGFFFVLLLLGYCSLFPSFSLCVFPFYCHSFDHSSIKIIFFSSDAHDLNGLFVTLFEFCCMLFFCDSSLIYVFHVRTLMLT